MTRVIKPFLSPVFTVLCALLVTGIAAQAQVPPTNRTLLDSCVSRVVRNVAAHWGTSRIDVTIDSSRNLALLAAPLYKAAAAHGGQGDGTECRAHITEAQTYYKALGDDRVARTVSVRVAFALRSARVGGIDWANEETAAMSDTIRCGDIVAVERGEGIPAAHAPDPCVEEASALTSIVEPLVLAVASATIVVLLFTIRGR